MKALAKDLIYRALAHFNFGGTVILMYHSVGWNGKLFTVNPEDFERQMKYIKKEGFRIIDLMELAELTKKRSNLAKTLVITFDDGYEDNYINVFPVLKKYSIKAIIFVVTAYLGQTIAASDGVTLKILSPEQIREMSVSGLIEFGAHGHEHIKLTKLSQPEIEYELKTSKQTLADILNKEVYAFAYPFGRIDDSIKAAVGRYFKIACGVKKGRINQKADSLELNRNSVDAAVSFGQFKGIVHFGRI